MGRLRDFVLGVCTTRTPSAEQVADEAKNYWRLPGEFGDGGATYHVWFVLGVPPGWKLGFFVHNLADRAPAHNHGGRLLSLILWGGYVEERYDHGPWSLPRLVRRRPLRLNWIDTQTYHAIRELPRGKAVTLVLLFPTVQQVHYAVKGASVAVKDYWRQVMEESSGRRDAHVHAR